MSPVGEVEFGGTAMYLDVHIAVLIVKPEYLQSQNQPKVEIWLQSLIPLLQRESFLFKVPFANAEWNWALIN